MKVTVEPVIVLEDGDRCIVTTHSESVVSIHHFTWRVTMSAEQARALAKALVVAVGMGSDK